MSWADPCRGCGRPNADCECSIPMLNKKGVQEMEKRIKLDIDAYKVLDLIVAEFVSDPNSTACFDERIVKEAIRVMKEHKKLLF